MPSTTGFTLWLTGMHGTGKSTYAAYIAARLRQVGRNVEILDEGEIGDDLWQGLGETKEERSTVVRRLGYVAQLLTRNNVAVIVPCVSPYKSVREENRRVIGKYVEVYVDCPTEKLIERDTTGKYKKALSGEIPNFIGITEPYEPPTSPEVTIHSDTESVEDGAMKIFQSLLDLSLVTQDELKIITGKKMKANPLPKKARQAETKPETKPGKGAKARPATRAARVAKPAAAPKKGSKRK
jgi:adenylylsulfate kinase